MKTELMSRVKREKDSQGFSVLNKPDYLLIRLSS